MFPRQLPSCTCCSFTSPTGNCSCFASSEAFTPAESGAWYCHWVMVAEVSKLVTRSLGMSVPTYLWARMAQSAQRLATGWMMRGSNPGGGEISRTCPDRPWGPPSVLYNGYRVFPGGIRVKRPRRGVDHPPLYSPEVKERVELYLYSHSVLSWPVLGWSFFITTYLATWHIPEEWRNSPWVCSRTKNKTEWEK
jgi:hypothetical protein